MQRISASGVVSHKGDIGINVPLLESQGASWKRVWKGCKRQRSGRTEEKQCLLDMTRLQPGIHEGERKVEWI